jgi:NAD dependent epimerase/dehydratase family
MDFKMRLLITGSTGFIGQHLLKTLGYERAESDAFSVSLLNRNEIDLLSRDAVGFIMENVQPTHVLHLAWADTSGPSYDLQNSHSDWANATFSMMRGLSDLGIVSWGIGTGLEFEEHGRDLTPYGIAKLDLKRSVVELNDPLCRWISMPYVFSIFHKRPRMILSCLQSEELAFPEVKHDFLEVRDVANQLSRIVCTSDTAVSSVSSGYRTSNVELCTKVLEKEKFQLFRDCSCSDNNHWTTDKSLSFFTTTLLN